MSGIWYVDYICDNFLNSQRLFLQKGDSVVGLSDWGSNVKKMLNIPHILPKSGINKFPKPTLLEKCEVAGRNWSWYRWHQIGRGYTFSQETGEKTQVRPNLSCFPTISFSSPDNGSAITSFAHILSTLGLYTVSWRFPSYSPDMCLAELSLNVVKPWGRGTEGPKNQSTHLSCCSWDTRQLGLEKKRKARYKISLPMFMFLSFSPNRWWVSITFLLLFSHSVMSDSLQPHGLQHVRLPCPSPSSRTCSNSCHWVSDAIQPSHPLSSPSPPALNLSQHEGLFQWVSSSHQVARVLELQL